MKVINDNIVSYSASKRLRQLEPIDFHCHGVGRFDFTEVPQLVLQEIEDTLAAKHTRSILTLYLPKYNFKNFIRLMKEYDRGRQTNQYPHIVGIALEGPLLASHGGTPLKSVWVPNQKHWEQIAKLGRYGLTYVIFSPDAELADFSADKIDEGAVEIDVKWITRTLLEGGVLPSPGHFKKDNPEKSAQRIRDILSVVEEMKVGPIVTDHLFNDMPLNFKHAWRTSETRINREKELKENHMERWNKNNYESCLGAVPGALIEGAFKGLIKICLNFDGEHVDLAIAKKAVELVGADNLMIMTDSIESKVLAGRPLNMKEDSTLLYQDEGIVAAGTQGMERQVRNMRSIGLTEQEIKKITCTTAAKVLGVSRYVNYEIAA